MSVEREHDPEVIAKEPAEQEINVNFYHFLNKILNKYISTKNLRILAKEGEEGRKTLRHNIMQIYILGFIFILF